MFEKLIESGSHRQDISRKGSFFLGTLGVYALLLLLAGLGSVYAYDAHLERQELQLSVLLTPVLTEQPTVRDNKPEPSRNESNTVERVLPTRITPYSSVEDPLRFNQQISTAPHNALPVPHGPFIISNVDSDPPAHGLFTGNNSMRSGNSHSPVVEMEAPPPLAEHKPQPAPTPRPRIMTLGVIEGKAVSKPLPVYSAIAKAAHASGPVVVQIIVDENGKVISAKALSGHALLQQAAVQAAYQAKFSPTLLSNVPVKVSGMITYNFVLQ